MDTTTRKFTSMGSYLGSVNDPVSLHKYLYANANPVKLVSTNLSQKSAPKSIRNLLDILVEKVMQSKQ